MTAYLDYNLDANGNIIDAGRFEGEPGYTPYFWTMLMDGCADDEYVNSDDIAIAVFNIEKQDKAMFPELTGYNVIEVWCDDNGFCHHKLFANDEHAAHMQADLEVLEVKYPECNECDDLRPHRCHRHASY